MEQRTIIHGTKVTISTLTTTLEEAGEGKGHLRGLHVFGFRHQGHDNCVMPLMHHSIWVASSTSLSSTPPSRSQLIGKDVEPCAGYPRRLRLIRRAAIHHVMRGLRQDRQELRRTLWFRRGGACPRSS